MNLKINGKTYPLEWGMGAIEMYCDRQDCDIDDIDIHLMSPRQIDSIRALNNLTLAAIENGCDCAVPKIEFDLTKEVFRSWLDKQPQSIANEIIDDWKKSFLFGKTVAEHFFGEVQDEPEKVNKKKRPSAK